MDVYRPDFVRAIGHSDQLVDLQIALLHDPANLSVLASAHGDVEPAVGGQFAVDIDIERAVSVPLNCDGRAHLLQFLWGDSAVHFHAIHPRQIGLWILQQPLERVVVGD